MYERIVVPLDGSKVGEAALPHVEALVSKLAPKGEVEVILLQVISSLSHYVIAGEASAQIPYTEKETEQLREEARNYLDKAGEGLRAKGAIVKPEVRTGRAAEEIIKFTEETKADMVAMSTHGRTGLSRWAFGSVTDHVLRGGNVPVLMVRAPREVTKP